MKRFPPIPAVVAVAVVFLTAAMVFAHPRRGVPAGGDERVRIRRLPGPVEPAPAVLSIRAHARPDRCNLSREQLRTMRPELDAAYDRAIARIHASAARARIRVSGEDTDYRLPSGRRCWPS